MTMTLEPITDTRLDDADFEAAIERLRAHVEQLEEAKEQRGQAAQHADAGSLERAGDLAAVFRDKRWVDQVAAPAKKRRGRKVKPDSPEQFFKWVRDHITSPKTGRPLARTRSQQLLDVEETTRIIATGGKAVAAIRGATEWALRPLTKLREERAEEIPEVWQRAVQLADGQTPTSAHVSKALAEHNKALIPAPSAGSSTETDQHQKARTIRERMLRDLQALMDVPGGAQEWDAFRAEAKRLLHERAGVR